MKYRPAVVIFYIFFLSICETRTLTGLPSLISIVVVSFHKPVLRLEACVSNTDTS